jgi:Spy/CpxP family protein refolding chaperone
MAGFGGERNLGQSQRGSRERDNQKFKTNFRQRIKNDQRIKHVVTPRQDKALSKNKAFKSVGRFSIRWP